MRALLVLLLLVGCRRGAEETTQEATSRPSSTRKSSDEPAVPESCEDIARCELACLTCEISCGQKSAALCHQLGVRQHALLSDEGLTKSAEAHDRACRNGHHVACSALGLLHQDGRGVPRDIERAIALFSRACEAGAGIGCFNLGAMYFSGHGVDIHEERAKEHFAKARKLFRTRCDAGEHEWCMNLGVMYEENLEVPPDLAKAAEIYEVSCKAGHTDSCGNLALLKLEGRGVPTNVAEAVSTLQRGCESASAGSCVSLVHALVKSEGDTANGDRLAAAARRGCELGASRGCDLLAALHGIGKGVPVDPAKARDLHLRACRGGSGMACTVVAKHDFEHSQLESARQLLEKACWIGDAEGCHYLGGMHHVGRGVPANPVLASSHFREGCKLGWPQACLVLLETQQPLPLPDGRKRVFLEAACKEGIALACNALPPPAL